MEYDEQTEQQYFERMERAAKTLTQDQIEACAWVMGASRCGWTREKVLNALPLRTYKEEC